MNAKRTVHCRSTRFRQKRTVDTTRDTVYNVVLFITIYQTIGRLFVTFGKETADRLDGIYRDFPSETVRHQCGAG